MLALFASEEFAGTLVLEVLSAAGVLHHFTSFSVVSHLLSICSLFQNAE